MSTQNEKTGCSRQLFRNAFLLIACLWLVSSIILALVQSMGVATVSLSGAFGQAQAVVKPPFLGALFNSMWFFGIACFGPFFMLSLLYFVLVGMGRSKRQETKEKTIV